MSDLISRAEALKYIPSEEPISRMVIAQLPTIEAEPIKHGTWEETAIVVDEPIVEYKCSICGGYTYWHNYLVVPNYCPNCGARMDGGENGTD